MSERESQSKIGIVRQLRNRLSRVLFDDYSNTSLAELQEIAGNVKFDTREFVQLFREPGKRILMDSRKWRSRELTEEEKSALTETLFQNCQEYEGDAREEMFSRLMAMKDHIDSQGVEDFVLDSFTRGEVQSWVIVQGLGAEALLKLDPTVLEERFRSDNYKEFLMRAFLSNFGMIRPSYGSHEKPPTTEISESTVRWLPSVAYAVEYFHPYEIIPREKITQFFASFPYDSAVPYLARAIESGFYSQTKRIGREVVAREVVQKDVIGTKVESSSHVTGSWSMDCEDITITYRYDSVKYTYENEWEVSYPIADGAAMSLTKLAEDRPPPIPEVEEALRKYREKYEQAPTIKERPTIVKEENLRELGTTVDRYSAGR